jgi:hypothetical protein
MDWPITLVVTLVAAAVAAFCGWRGARPPDLLRGPRLVPWRLLMTIAFFCMILGLVHLANLGGMTTGGTPKPGG